ncbi:MAG: hypothetical protein GKR89_09875 [Candidatus Latescibacteria bacterium]|nr:hypothetical protein [Candidatus Latescibacterota bacterium]
MPSLTIAAIEVFRLEIPPPTQQGPQPQPSAWERLNQAHPMDRFGLPPRYGRPGGVIWVKITASDGTWGLGSADAGSVTSIIIEESLAPLIVGQEVGAIDLCNDLMWKGTLSFGNEGLTAMAVAGIDLALWDLWGKILDQPVYRLAGGPARQTMEAYCTGQDVEWNQSQGFSRFKVVRPASLYHGRPGIDQTVEMVAALRDQIGPQADLMMDCWMCYDVDYAVRICEALRPYTMRWMEEMLLPQDWNGHRALRQRLPWQSMATGEHWSTRHPGLRALEEGLVDLIQADLMWIGGFTEAMKLAHAADAAGVPMCLHTGANDLFGQHWTAAMPNSPLIEYFQGSPPGVPFAICAMDSPSASGRQTYRMPPGTPPPVDGRLGLPPGPGFGLQIKEEWLHPL